MIAPINPKPRFYSGQLVRHIRYGYRGVVVEVDLSCEAPSGWYKSNKSQPNRLQPWYHVLVHGSGTTTYAAEDSLDSDPNLTPIKHPWIKRYFTNFDGDAYVRNDTNFDGWDT